MSITDRRSNPNIGRNRLMRRWCVTSQRIRKRLAGIRNPCRADVHRTEDNPETPPPPEERAQALAAVCEALLRQFDDEQAAAAEIRLVVHKRENGSRLDSQPGTDAEDGELLWELRRLLASSGGTIADVAHALERRGDEVDDIGRALLRDEVGAVEIDVAILKSLLADPVDWDSESKRLLAGEIPPFEDGVDDDDEDD